MVVTAGNLGVVQNEVQYSTFKSVLQDNSEA